MISPRTPPGVLELLPPDQAAMRRMLDTVRRSYERFGFVEIETPVFERTDVLLTKTGGDTERQVYFVQSTGAIENGSPPEMALRFDLTVPLARYVAEHQNDLTFPFKRYQIQRSYRGERPQRGRFREFYQCDIDVIGRETLSFRHDGELPAVIAAVFADLGVGDFTIRINSRTLMRGLLESLGIDVEERQADILRTVDKLDRLERDGVAAALRGDGVPAAVAEAILDLAVVRRVGATAAIAHLDAIPPANDLVRQGVEELTVVFSTLEALGVDPSVYALDLGVARGLDYYTGTVYETVLDDHPEIGSVCSGGRYENLAGMYTSTKLPGVGLSIGLTRLFWQLREAGLVAAGPTSVEAYVTVMDDDGVRAAMRLTTLLREAGVNTDVAPEPAKLGKQMKHADRLGARVALIVGEDERANGTVTVRDLAANEQFEVAERDVAEAVLTRIRSGAS